MAGWLLRRLLPLLALGAAASGTAQGQTDSVGRAVARQLARYEQRGPQEKLFLHLDRPVYLAGELMWFKVYAVDGGQNKPLALSSVAYVEVLNQANQPVLQGKVALANAVGRGSFSLPGALASGHYTVRAYTSWMQNFGPETYFHTSVTVVNTFAASAAAVRKDSAAHDAQFFPEGGHLVKGLRSTVAFKVTDRNGRGMAARGRVLNGRGQEVAAFQTLRLGMGRFSFTPASEQETYTAVLTLATKQVLTRRLPRVQEQGYVLHLEASSPTQLTLTVNATRTQPETVFVLGHARKKVAVANSIQLVNGQAVLVVNKSQLPEGVTHFTLFDAGQKPLCERLYFRPPTSTLALTARADKAHYAPREQVHIEAALAAPTPRLAASLSMAVYRLDSLNATPALAIDRYLGLTSDLKGNVENPDYYFMATGPEAEAATDNLMLTQGWSRFRWEDVLRPAFKPFEHLPEPNGPLIRGRISQAGTNLPQPNIMTYLSSPSRIIQLNNSQSNAQGQVQFEMNDFVGPQEIVVQTDPQQDSTCRITITDPFSAQYASRRLPGFGINTRFETDYAKRHLQNQVQNVYAGKYRNHYRRLPADSLAFYGKPDQTYLLDKYTRFKVLEEVLREYVPGVVVRIRKDGFHFLVADNVNQTLQDRNPMVLLDGVPVFDINKIMAMPPIKIQKLDVITSRYFQGLAVYDGIVSFTTYKGDLEGFQLDPRVLVQRYEGVQQQREFYAPRYDTPQAAQSRLPDLRNLLYWNPDIQLTGAVPRQLDFFTGDQAGRYLVVLQGLATNGLAGSTSFVLEVKPAL